MKINQREFSNETDKRAMAALVRDFPANNLHVVDLPYRLSSWAFDFPENIGLWVNADGQLLAWAVMQTPFGTIDYAYHPNAGKSLHQLILAWANERACRIAATPSGRNCWFVNVFGSLTERIRELEEMGFASQANVGRDSWSKVFMQNSAQIPVGNHNLPDGFSIRPLAGENEVDACVQLHRAVFQTKNMTIEWRKRTLRHPEYISDIDLVAVAPDGRLAAFCACWLDKNSEIPSGQVEPLGVHQDFRRLGLGRAILSEGLRRLYRLGARQTFVETDNYRNAAFHLYESTGFRVTYDVLVYRKDYDNQN